MESEKKMEESVGKLVRITFFDGNSIEKHCEEYVRKETDEEEPMLFLEGNTAVMQSEIKSIEIIN